MNTDWKSIAKNIQQEIIDKLLNTDQKGEDVVLRHIAKAFKDGFDMGGHVNPVVKIELIRPDSPCYKTSKCNALIKRVLDIKEPSYIITKKCGNDLVLYNNSTTQTKRASEHNYWIVEIRDFGEFAMIVHLNCPIESKGYFYIFTKPLANILSFVVTILYGQDFKELSDFYSAIAWQFFNQPKSFYPIENVLIQNKIRMLYGNCCLTFDERWLEAIYLGAILDNKIANKQESKERLFSSSTWKNHLNCQHLIDRIVENNSDAITLPDTEMLSCPCYHVFVRDAFWRAFQAKTLSTDNRYNFLGLIDKLVVSLEPLPPWNMFAKNGKDYLVSQPDVLHSKLIDQTLHDWPELELARTRLMAIFFTASIYEGRAANNVIATLVRTWTLLRAAGRMRTLEQIILDYLKIWQNSLALGQPQLYLSPDWLIAWFSLRLLKSLTFRVYMQEDNGMRKFSLEENIQFHRSLSAIFLYVLFWIRNFGDSRRNIFADVIGGYQTVLESLIHLLCEYTHVDGELTRQADLHRAMTFMWAQQSALYTLSETYRDHLHHVLEVCLMGLFFMDIHTPAKLLSTKKMFFSNLLKRTAPSSPASLLRNWIVAALMHDLGYAVKLLGLPLDHLAFFSEPTINSFWSELKSKHDLLKKEYGQKAWETLSNFSPDLPLPENLEDLDHGAVSALLIAHLVDGLDQDLKNDLKFAIIAAAMHGNHQIPMDPQAHPLPFLLFLCDNLQEWDRPLIKGEQFRFSLLVNIINTGSNELHSSKSYVKHLILENVRLNDSVQPFICAGAELHCLLDFAPAWEMEYYPPMTWVGHQMALQRVEHCDLPIKISLRHPIQRSSEGSGKPVLEIDLFQTFLRESGHTVPAIKKSAKPEVGNSVLRQWIVDARAGRSWYKYEVEMLNDSPLFEIMSFELTKSEGKRLVPKAPDHYIAHYIDWVRKYRKGIYTKPEMSSFTIK